MNSGNSLTQTLEHERKQSMLRQAAMIRDWDDSPERSVAAKELIRESLVAWATGRITQETESMIYTVLGFAMPEDNAETLSGEEAAFQEQLRRQSCLDCGEGRCPTGD